MPNTAQPNGSVMQLLRVAFPLILSSLSGMGMLFVDRLVLAGYSLEAHNAAVEASNFGWAFITGWGTLGSVTQIFVSQNFGAKKYNYLGRPVWQMIWLGLLSVLFFLPAAVYGPTLIYGGGNAFEMQRTYLSWMLLFGPCHCLFYALCGFFIGQGKTVLTSCAVFAGNIVNAILCYIFVNGWDGWVSPLGLAGAAIATNTAVLGQVALLAIFFFNQTNRKSFGSLDWKWDRSLAKDCIRVGLPSALFGVLEVAGWAVFYKMMASLGPGHLTVAGIVQNILILFNFFGDGLFRAVATLCGNAIGANQSAAIFKIVRAGFILMTGFMFCFALTMWAFHPFILSWFLGSSSTAELLLLQSALLYGLANAVLYKYLEGIRLVLSGALTAAADTLFLLFGGSCSVWIFMVLPVYLLVVRQEGSVELALSLCTLYTFLAAAVYAWRFYKGSWQNRSTLVARSASSPLLLT